MAIYVEKKVREPRPSFYNTTLPTFNHSIVTLSYNQPRR
jgi:hypothetical protein